jgi:hypothetical protein
MKMRGEWRFSSTILEFGTRWKKVVSFILGPLYPRGKSPRYPLDRSLSGPQNRSGLCGEDKKSPDPAGNRNPVVQPVDTQNELYNIKANKFVQIPHASNSVGTYIY